jgi:2-polyprenyl-6-methoxyphenol hydroxylase-like FAD-dependent oxidoreductase
VKRDVWDVVIVGSGGGGFALALLLARKGLRIAVVEATPRVRSHGEILQPNGIRVLDQLGLLKPVMDAGAYTWHRVHFARAAGERLCTVDYQTLPPPYHYALIVLPAMIREVFLNAVGASPQTQKIQIFQSDQPTTLLWEAGRIAGVVTLPHTLHAPIVVGADGVFSSMRTAMGLSASVHTYANGYFALALERPEGFDPDLRFYMGKAVFFAVMPGPQRKLFILYQTPVRDRERIQARGLSALKADIRTLNPEIAAFMEVPLAGLDSWAQVPYLSAHRVRCTRWTVDGGVLMGDAAHAMNPHVAQGRNAAMVDAVVLSDVIAECFRRGDFSRRVLAEYEALRRPEIETYQRLADELTWLWESRLPPLIWARERIFRSIHQDRRLHDKILTTTAGLQLQPFNLYDRWRALHLWGTIPANPVRHPGHSPL